MSILVLAIPRASHLIPFPQAPEFQITHHPSGSFLPARMTPEPMRLIRENGRLLTAVVVRQAGQRQKKDRLSGSMPTPERWRPTVIGDSISPPTITICSCQ